MAKGRGGLSERCAALCGCLLLVLVALFLRPSPARADVDFCTQGEGAGQCAAPGGINSLRGLAFDTESGRLYVADRGNNRVDVFEEEGGEYKFRFAFGWKVNATTPEEKLQTCTIATGCREGTAGSGAGQLDNSSQVAVDNAPASLSHHDVYVASEISGDRRVQKFDPTGAFLAAIGSEGEAEGQLKGRISIGVGPAGVLYALDNLPLGELRFKQRLQRFEPSGGEISPQCILFEGGFGVALAVRSDGGFWVATENEGAAIRRYDSSCAQQGAPVAEGVETNVLALDEAGRLFAGQTEDPYRVVSAYGATGGIERRFAYGKIPLGNKPEGLAARSAIAGGGIFLALGDSSLETASIRRLEFPGSPTPDLPPPGPITASVETERVGSAKALARAEINPEGKQTEVHVEYLTKKAFEEQGGFEGPATEETEPESMAGEGFELSTAEGVTIGCPDPATEFGNPADGCLEPETEYRFRVVATNPDGAGEGTLDGGEFTTGPPIEVGDTYATDPGTDTVHLAADVNPEGIPATGFFEYVDDAHFQESGFATATKAPDVDHGAAPLDFGGAEEPITRSIAVFPLLPGTAYHFRLVVDNPVIEPIVGEEHVVRTFAAPTGGGPCENEASRIGAGALLPDCRAYELVSPLDKGGGDIRVLKAQLGAPAVLEQAAESGDGLAYGSIFHFAGAPSAPYTSQYIAQRVPGLEWQTHSIDPPRGAPLIQAIAERDTELQALSPDLCEAWIGTFAEFPAPTPPGYRPGYVNLLRRSDRLCGAEAFEALAPQSKPTGVVAENFRLALEGVSADGSHAIFTANGKLATNGNPGGAVQLYESVGGGAPKLVCVLPGGGGPVNGSCTAGSAEDGLYVRQASLGGAISADGQRVFWSAPGRGEGKLYLRTGGLQSVAVSKAAEEEAGTERSWFWGAAADGSRAVFTTGGTAAGLGDLNGEGRLYTFNVNSKTTSSPPIAEGLYGVAGMSEDAKRIYFASSKALAAGGVAGKANLYLYEEGAGISFVATLASADVRHAVSKEAFRHTSRVSPDGSRIAFVSVAGPASEAAEEVPGPTGYNNTQAGSSTGCGVIEGKDAPGQPCREVYLYDATTKRLVCASCNPSGARPAGRASIAPFESGLHAARALSDDGARLYFQSADKLAPQDSNGREDVYQWERPGTGGCETGSATFSADAEGCVGLISSGESPEDARFVEADPDGKNVFFATGASLLPQDPGLIDIYDARVGGGLPIPPPSPPPCEGDACHAQVAAPQPQSPASAGYHAPNGKSQGRKRCPKGKRAVKRKGKKKGKARCVHKHKHRHHKRKRAPRRSRRAGR